MTIYHHEKLQAYAVVDEASNITKMFFLTHGNVTDIIFHPFVVKWDIKGREISKSQILGGNCGWFILEDEPSNIKEFITPKPNNSKHDIAISYQFTWYDKDTIDVQEVEFQAFTTQEGLVEYHEFAGKLFKFTKVRGDSHNLTVDGVEQMKKQFAHLQTLGIEFEMTAITKVKPKI